jgi:hypothetical protein
MAHSVDIQKQRYAHELAEYTMKQYDLARQSLERGRAPSTTASPQERSKSHSRDGQPSAPSAPSVNSG